MACKSLQHNECELAIAGGVSLILSPELSLAFGKSGMLASDGKCKTFDKNADGYVRSEGSAVVLLKRLDKAMAEGDNILAIIKSSVVNQDGASNGLTAPNVKAQEDLMRESLRQAKISANDINYIETHGTGTALGDPIEVEALANALASRDKNLPPIWVGSIKTNLGHTEATSGLAGLIKVILMMRKKSIPKHLNIKEINPLVLKELIKIPAVIPLKEEKIDTKNNRLLATVSSFGFSGTNVQLVVENISDHTNSFGISEGSSYILCLSAQNFQSLQALAIQYEKYFIEEPEDDLLSICCTASEGRAHFKERLAIVFRNKNELLEALKSYIYGQPNNNVRIGTQQKNFHQENFIDLNSDLFRLAEFYVEGGKINWKKLIKNINIKRCMLPGYVFQRLAHWFPKDQNLADMKHEKVKEFFYQIKWHKVNDADKLISSILATVIFIPFSLYDRVSNIKLENVIFIFPEKDKIIKETFVKKNNDPNCYWVKLDDEIGVYQLKEIFNSLHIKVERVIYLWPIGDIGIQENSYYCIANLIKYHSSCLLTIVKILSTHPQGYLSKLCIFTKAGIIFDGQQQVGEISLSQSALYGLANVIRTEYPTTHCRYIDLDNQALEDINSIILKEQNCDSKNTAWSAYYLGDYYQAKLEQCDKLNLRSFAACKAASYLITGGLGALGLEAAATLIELGAEHIILLSRRGIASPANQAKLTGLMKSAQIYIVSADVSELQDLRQALCNISENIPSIVGVIHAAGVLEDVLIPHQTWQNIEKVLRVKAEGAWNLHQITYHLKLDFFILYSSISSILGIEGQANYAMSNAFLDAFAKYRTMQGLPTLTINWGPWDIGMARDEATLKYLNKKHNLLPLADSEAKLALEHILTESMPNVIVANISKNKEEKIEKTIHFTREKVNIFEGMAKEGRENYIVNQIVNITQKVLKIEHSKPVPLKEPLQNLGLDSLTAMEIVKLLNEVFSMNFSAAILYDYPSIAELAQYTLRLLQEEVVSPYPIDNHSIIERDESIAIVGYGCRFPGLCSNPEEFWRLLEEGIDGIQELKDKRWDMEALYDPNPDAPGKLYSRFAGLLDDIGRFDCEFFSISPHEAQCMDPQQRILLEVAWETIESAGYAPDTLYGKNAAVFIGIMNSEYGHQQLTGNTEHITAHMSTGSALSVASGRLSYFFGWNGPSLSIDTACSSSLVAVHYACQSLRNNECEFALAGGINLLLSPELSISLSRARMLSADGRCKTFDQSANGYVRSEGCGLILLKRLSDAIKVEDTILGVIKGSAVNQDGRSQGLTAPNGIAQKEVIRKALQNASINPGQVSYVEAHGTGTALGDPIEVHAICSSYRKDRDQKKLTIGSVKSNIGHCETAAGIAGLIKILLMFEHKKIPGTAHLDKLNTLFKINDAEFDMKLNFPKQLTNWEPHQGMRIAGLSSFGFSGTNAHMILAEHLTTDISKDLQNPSYGIMTLSANNIPTLKAYLEKCIVYLNHEHEHSFIDICYTSSCARSHFPYRIAFLCSNKQELRQKMQEALQEESFSALEVLPPGLCFIFNEYDENSIKWGYDIYQTLPLFRREIDSVLNLLDRVFLHVVGVDFCRDREFFFSSKTHVDLSKFIIEYCLAKMWIALNVKPIALLSVHASLISVACFSGVITLHDAVLMIIELDKLKSFKSSIKEYQSIVLKLHFKEPEISIFNGLTGICLDDKIGLAEFWIQHLQEEKIHSAKNIVNLKGEVVNSYLEMGLHQSRTFDTISSIDMLSSNYSILKTLKTLYCYGHQINWHGYFQEQDVQKVKFPTRPFRGGHYWLKPSQKKYGHFSNGESWRSVLGHKTTLASSNTIIYEQSLDNLQPFNIKDHQLYNEIVIPGAAYLALTILMLKNEFGDLNFILRDIIFSKPLIINKNKKQVLQNIILNDNNQGTIIQSHSRTVTEKDEGVVWEQHFQSRLDVDQDHPHIMRMEELSHIQSKMEGYFTGEEYYQKIGHCGYHLSNSFCCIQRLWHNSNESLTALELNFPLSSEEYENFYPGLIDAVFQGTLICIPDKQFFSVSRKEMYVPSSIDEIHISQNKDKKFWCYSRRVQDNLEDESYVYDIMLMNENHEVVMQIKSLKIKKIAKIVLLQPTIEKACYTIQWREIKHPSKVENKTDGWLIFSDNQGLGQALSKHLRSEGKSTKEITHDEDSYYLEPNIEPQSLDEHNFTKLFESITNEKEHMSNIIYLWALDTLELNNCSKADLTKALYFSCIQTLKVMQEITKIKQATTLRLWLVTKGSQKLDDSKLYSPLQSTLWGLAKVFAQEHPEFNTTLIDLYDSQHMLEDILLAMQQPILENMLAIRKKQVYVPRLSYKPRVLNQHVISGVSSHGSYLITGGTGGLARLIISWLIEQGARSLILIVRRNLNIEEDYFIEEKRKMGISIMIYHIDVTDIDNMKQVLEALPDTFPLKGIVHTAGIIQDGMIAKQSMNDFLNVMPAKILGTQLLYNLTKNISLDFFILFSSAASILGSKGQANYAAANSYLDALAEYASSEDRRVTSINWGSWDAIGMTTQTNSIFNKKHPYPITIDLGMKGFERAISTKDPKLIFVPGGVAAFRAIAGDEMQQLWSEWTNKKIIHQSTKEITAQHFFTTLAELSLDDRRKLLYQEITKIISTVMKLDHNRSFAADENLQDIGMDSLLAVDLRNNLNKLCNKVLPSTLLYDYPTINKLIDFLLQTMQLDVSNKIKTIAMQKLPVSEPDSIAYWDSDSLEEKLREQIKEFADTSEME